MIMGSTTIINHRRRMFILLWMTLLLTVRGNAANKGQTKELTQEAGTSAVIPCHLPDNSGFKKESAVWYKCDQQCTESDKILSFSNSSPKSGADLNGRVSLQEPDLQLKNYSIVIKNLTNSDSGSYELRVLKGTNEKIMCKAKITVTDVKKRESTGETTVKKAESLNVTCSVDSSPPSVLTCTKHGSNTTLISGNGTATLVIPPLELNNSGLYICTATHLTNTPQKKVNVTVTSSPEILNSSGCTNHPKVLICSCISRGDPLPSIKWPLLEKHKHFFVDTTKSGNTVRSILIMPTEDQNEADVECVSSIRNENVTQKLVIKKAKQEDEDLIEKLLRILTQLEVIIAFSSGVLISAICCCTCCLLGNCHRKKQKTRGDMPVTLEMVTSQEDPLMDGGQADNLDIDQEALQGEEGPAEGKPDGDYSALDFSRIKRKNPEEAETTQDTTETEYAEIKKGGAAAGQEEEIGEEEVTGQDEETNGVGGEDAAAQCNMEDISGQSYGDVYPQD